MTFWTITGFCVRFQQGQTSGDADFLAHIGALATQTTLLVSTQYLNPTAALGRLVSLGAARAAVTFAPHAQSKMESACILLG